MKDSSTNMLKMSAFFVRLYPLCSGRLIGCEANCMVTCSFLRVTKEQVKFNSTRKGWRYQNHYRPFGSLGIGGVVFSWDLLRLDTESPARQPIIYLIYIFFVYHRHSAERFSKWTHSRSLSQVVTNYLPSFRGNLFLKTPDPSPGSGFSLRKRQVAGAESEG